MKKVARIGAIAFLLFAGISKPKASALFILCEDVCSRGQSCGRTCSDDSGFTATCGDYGCCIGQTDFC